MKYYTYIVSSYDSNRDMWVFDTFNEAQSRANWLNFLFESEYVDLDAYYKDGNSPRCHVYDEPELIKEIGQEEFLKLTSDD